MQVAPVPLHVVDIWIVYTDQCPWMLQREEVNMYSMHPYLMWVDETRNVLEQKCTLPFVNNGRHMIGEVLQKC
jgi:hypothetical protein